MKIFKKMLVFTLIISILTIGIQTSVGAISNVNEIIPSIMYISEQDAILLANQCIEQQKNFDSTCSWNEKTIIYDEVKLYDFQQNVNAYIFRLKTINKETGYVFVDTSSESPSVQAFGYDCNFMLDQMNLNDIGKKVNSSDKIIYAYNLTFLKSINSNDVEYEELSTHKIVNSTKKKLIDLYKKEKLIKKDDVAINNLSQLKINTVNATMTTSITPMAQVTYDWYNISGIWDTGYQIYITSDFPGYTNHCSPTAGTNLIYYWGNHSPNKKTSLWTGGVFVDLYHDMNCNSCNDIIQFHTGTLDSDIIPGLTKYGTSRGCSIAGSDSSNGSSWSWICTNLNNNNPLIVGISNDPTYGDHSIFAVGWTNTSTGDYLRIADGWSKTFSNFYKYKGSIDGARYVRW